MGILSDLFSVTPQSEPVDVAASLAPFYVNETALNIFGGNIAAQRQSALSVPALARANGIITSTVGSLPIEKFNDATGERLPVERSFKQPDPRIPASVVYSYLAQDLWLYGVAYGQVLDMYAATDGGRVRQWTRLDPQWVSVQTNPLGTEVIGYSVNGQQVPMQGVGSIIAFYNLAESGLLNRAGRTIRAAIELEKAAEIYAKEPLPTMVLKSTGTNLPSERIKSLLESWKISRQNRSTAFLNADIELQALGFDPKQLQLSEARQYIALELARQAGIPAYFLSAESTSMTYSNATSERRSLIDFSLRPILTAIESRLSMSDFTPNGTHVRFDLDDFLRGNPLERAQIYQILSTIGAMTVEEIRKAEDLLG
jgi:HK97 family phage portal protein